MKRVWIAIIVIATYGHLAPTWSQKIAQSPQSKASEWLGVVTQVSDGDTLWIKPLEAERRGNNKPMKIRLSGIDAPETCQSFGAQSRDALQRRIDEAPLGASGNRREVRVQRLRPDDYGRSLSKVYIRESARGDFTADLAALQVKSGMAWSYGFRRDPGPYIEQQREAQAKRRGLFSDPGAINPREFRKRNGPCESHSVR